MKNKPLTLFSWTKDDSREGPQPLSDPISEWRSVARTAFFSSDIRPGKVTSHHTLLPPPPAPPPPTVSVTVDRGRLQGVTVVSGTQMAKTCLRRRGREDSQASGERHMPLYPLPFLRWIRFGAPVASPDGAGEARQFTPDNSLLFNTIYPVNAIISHYVVLFQ